jgi:hypothetical protein
MRESIEADHSRDLADTVAMAPRAPDAPAPGTPVPVATTAVAPVQVEEEPTTPAPLTPFRVSRPSLPTQIHDLDEEPGSVERPTDEPYAPPIPAAFGRTRPPEA